MAVRIVLIHAVIEAMPPAHEAFRRLWPDAECWNLLDDSLIRDLGRAGQLSPSLFARFRMLTEYGVAAGASGVLFTCSAFGEAIEAAATAVPVPVLKPNEAMFEAALAAGRRVGMLATSESSIASLEDEFRRMAASQAIPATIETICVPAARRALQADDGGEHDRVLADASRSFRDVDVVLLAHFSTARAEAAVREALDCPVLTSPGSAVRKLKRLVDRPS